MKSIWLWLLAALVCACTEPQAGGRRGLYRNADAGRVAPDGATICSGVVCDTNATCAGSAGAQKCECSKGFEGDGEHCTDIDECADPVAACGPNADCANRSPGFGCTCKRGFVDDGKGSCKDVDECADGTSTCDPNADCANTDGSFTCTCKQGFEGSGFGCAKITGCAALTCAANEQCVDAPAAFQCDCSPGFARGTDGTCRALCDDAAGPVCPNHGLCRVEGRAAVCDACQPGFSGNGANCTAVTCQAACDGSGNDDAAHAVCKSDGTCACAPGYTGSAGSCADVDECATNNGGCGANGTCTNVDGGHLCSCKFGYTLDSNGQCVDVDECKQTPFPCHPDATCTNKTPEADPKGFACACKKGFTADGESCKDVDECATNNGGCPQGAACVNSRGSFACGCTAPLVGEPGSCHCDLSGIWAMRQDVDTCWGAVAVMQGSSQSLVEAGHMEATVWELHQIEYDGKTVNVKKKGCGGDNTPDLISVAFRETYSAEVPRSTFDKLGLIQGTPFDAPSLVPGSTFVGPREAAVLGIDLGSDPVNAPWPTSWDQVNPSSWVDSDGDGEPGLTLWPALPSKMTDKGTTHYSYIPARPAINGGSLVIDERAACVSVGLRVVVHVEGTLDTCTHITGKVVNEKTEGRVHSCKLVNKGSPCNTSQAYTLPGESPANCAGWGNDVTCTQADWAAASQAQRCADDDLGRLDNNQNQRQESKADFELEKIGTLADAATLTCDDVRSACFPPGSTNCGSIQRVAPTISCTSPP